LDPCSQVKGPRPEPIWLDRMTPQEAQRARDPHPLAPPPGPAPTPFSRGPAPCPAGGSRGREQRADDWLQSVRPGTLRPAHVAHQSVDVGITRGHTLTAAPGPVTCRFRAPGLLSRAMPSSTSRPGDPEACPLGPPSPRGRELARRLHPSNYDAGIFQRDTARLPAAQIAAGSPADVFTRAGREVGCLPDFPP
jgi:hypothetical protein